MKYERDCGVPSVDRRKNKTLLNLCVLCVLCGLKNKMSPWRFVVRFILAAKNAKDAKERREKGEYFCEQKVVSPLLPEKFQGKNEINFPLFNLCGLKTNRDAGRIRPRFVFISQTSGR
jgi:hypothetical protein